MSPIPTANPNQCIYFSISNFYQRCSLTKLLIKDWVLSNSLYPLYIFIQWTKKIPSSFFSILKPQRLNLNPPASQRKNLSKLFTMPGPAKIPNPVKPHTAKYLNPLKNSKSPAKWLSLSKPPLLIKSHKIFYSKLIPIETTLLPLTHCPINRTNHKTISQKWIWKKEFSALLLRKVNWTKSLGLGLKAKTRNLGWWNENDEKNQFYFY